MRRCKGCGEAFEPSHGNQEYCTPRCRYKANNRKRADYHSEYHKRYYTENREAICMQQKRYRLRKEAGAC